MPGSAADVEAFLANYPPDIQALTRRLRALVAEQVPGAVETLVARHNHFAYTPSGKPSERILYICPLGEWVRLGVDYGGATPDPASLLVGEGKRMRHVKVRSMEQANDPRLALLVVVGWQADIEALAQRRG